MEEFNERRSVQATWRGEVYGERGERRSGKGRREGEREGREGRKKQGEDMTTMMLIMRFEVKRRRKGRRETRVENGKRGECERVRGRKGEKEGVRERDGQQRTDRGWGVFVWLCVCMLVWLYAKRFYVCAGKKG